jgi:uncharacterized protein (TIGR00269 family)
MASCDKCGKRAIIYQKYSGMHLCERHFEDDVHRKIRESIRAYGIFSSVKKIAVALSGGKDSSSLLYVLNNLFSKRRDMEIVAIMVDEGIDGYRPHALRAAIELSESLEIPYVTLSFQDSFGITIDDVVGQQQTQGPCTFCGVFRKNILNKTARDMGADVLATGHNLDDESQTVMLNYLRGDIDRLYRLYPRKRQKGMVLRVKPLRRVPEMEVALYAKINDLPHDRTSCPYRESAMRLEVAKMLSEFEARHPGSMYSIMQGFERIIKLQQEKTFQVIPCNRCGEPSGNGMCQSCRLLDLVIKGA